VLEKNIEILLENAPKALRNQLLRRLAAMAPGSTLKVMKNGKARRWREREREREMCSLYVAGWPVDTWWPRGVRDKVQNITKWQT
jgi:hypothetical protein